MITLAQAWQIGVSLQGVRQGAVDGMPALWLGRRLLASLVIDPSTGAKGLCLRVGGRSRLRLVRDARKICRVPGGGPLRSAILVRLDTVTEPELAALYAQARAYAQSSRRMTCIKLMISTAELTARARRSRRRDTAPRYDWNLILG